MCVFTMSYIGDMPQQAENCGFKGPRAHKYCRFCFAGAKGDITSTAEPENRLNFDIVAHGRYHFQTRQMQRAMSEMPTQEARDDFGTQWGINNPEPALVTISPAADLVLTRPPDPAHSEYAGMTKMMHLFLRDVVMTVSARDEYANMLRRWPFPRGASRLMSPLHHLNSYNLSSHARWSMIVPTLLRHWLEARHIQPGLLAELTRHGDDPVDVVVGAYAALAKSNSVLMGRKLSELDRHDMDQIIRSAREKFRVLCVCAATASSRAGSTAREPLGLGEGGESSQVASGETRPAVVPFISKAGMELISDTLRPNFHIASHYPRIAKMYAIPKNLNTLAGESYHG